MPHWRTIYAIISMELRITINNSMRTTRACHFEPSETEKTEWEIDARIKWRVKQRTERDCERKKSWMFATIHSRVVFIVKIYFFWPKLFAAADATHSITFIFLYFIPIPTPLRGHVAKCRVIHGGYLRAINLLNGILRASFLPLFCFYPFRTGCR